MDRVKNYSEVKKEEGLEKASRFDDYLEKAVHLSDVIRDKIPEIERKGSGGMDR